jgi:hypothetical protein
MPVSIGLVAAGSQALLGLGQTLFSGRGKAERDFEAQAKNSPLAQESKSLNDYYQQARGRYEQNPYQSQQYQIGAGNIMRSTAQGINALQSRGAAIGGIGRLAGIQQNQLGNLGASAEAQRNASFGQYGQAAQAKTAQDKYLFDINQMTPYNRMLQVKQMKSQAANDRANAGLQMVGSALGSAANVGMASAYANPSMPKTNSNLSIPQYTAPQPTIAANYQRIFNMPNAPTSLPVTGTPYNPNSYDMPDLSGYFNNRTRRI